MIFYRHGLVFVLSVSLLIPDNIFSIHRTSPSHEQFCRTEALSLRLKSTVSPSWYSPVRWGSWLLHYGTSDELVIQKRTRLLQAMTYVLLATSGLVALGVVVNQTTGFHLARWYLQSQQTPSWIGLIAASGVSILVGTTSRLVGIYSVPAQRALYGISRQVVVGSFIFELIRRILMAVMTVYAFNWIEHQIYLPALRAFASLVFGMGVTFLFDVSFVQWQKYLKIRALAGDVDVIQATQTDFYWKKSVRNIGHACLARLPTSYFQHDLTQNLLPPEYRLFVLFTLGFLINVYATGAATTRGRLTVSKQNVFLSGIFWGSISMFLISWTGGVCAILLSLLSVTYFTFEQREHPLARAT